MQYYIEYKTDIFSEEEKQNEFNDIDILSKIISINQEIMDYFNNKKINYDYFMNYFCDGYYDIIINNDCLRKKDIFIHFFEDLEKNANYNQKFKNLEINILTDITCNNKNFINENLKYLLTVANYPNEKELEKAIKIFNEKEGNSLIMLNIFESLKNNEKDIIKLSHIEIINKFINSFSEEFNNIISRELSKKDTIRDYLNRNRDSLNALPNEQTLLEKQFDDYCKSYKVISDGLIDINSNIKREDNVEEILNDEIEIISKDNQDNKNGINKIEIKRTTINKLYYHLITIQNNILNKIIDNYNKNKNEEKEDIIIKNAINQINKEIPIQLATTSDVFSLKYSDPPAILSFEELYSFYSSKNIFNENNNKIDYSKYSEIKFNLLTIEKELTNNLLSGKKIFSKKQKLLNYLRNYMIKKKLTTKKKTN